MVPEPGNHTSSTKAQIHEVERLLTVELFGSPNVWRYTELDPNLLYSSQSLTCFQGEETSAELLPVAGILSGIFLGLISEICWDAIHLKNRPMITSFLALVQDPSLAILQHSK